MCGIVGYLGPRDLEEVLLAGLQRLEYRGYDSAGISGLNADGSVSAVRAVGNLANLRAAVEEKGGLNGANGSGVRTGIGHTRWATHGRVTEANAHPHFDTADRVHVVVNGIVENFAVLRERLIANGARFTSETDAEVIAHLIASHGEADLLDAVAAAVAELEGHYAFVVMSAADPGRLVAYRKECPLVIGQGDGELFVGSAIPAFLQYTRQALTIEDGEIVELRAEGATIYGSGGTGVIERAPYEVEWDEETAEKGGYDTFMLKEIHEQADAVAETIADRLWQDDAVDFGEDFDLEPLRAATRIVIVACGTSFHAGLLGRYVIEEYARVPVDVEVASEYRYRNPVLRPSDVVIGITQSGETADTLAAMRVARESGATVLAVTNVMGSQATRDADGVLFTRAGLEIGVAATKTFMCQLAVMYLLALKLAELRDTQSVAERRDLIAGLKAIPHAITELLEQSEASIKRAADDHHGADFFLYLGRHVGLPIALEGALKLKEVSYIATDAYPAGEMKHGPIALLDEQTPVVVVATNSPVREKVISNIQEVRARGAHVLAVVTAGDEAAMSEHTDEVFPVPLTDWTLQPLLAVIPLQLLAYEIAVRRGLNVDQPRNLAKTVTVE